MQRVCEPKGSAQSGQNFRKRGGQNLRNPQQGLALIPIVLDVAGLVLSNMTPSVETVPQAARALQRLGKEHELN
jgi:hypothetical protein